MAGINLLRKQGIVVADVMATEMSAIEPGRVGRAVKTYRQHPPETNGEQASGARPRGLQQEAEALAAFRDGAPQERRARVAAQPRESDIHRSARPGPPRKRKWQPPMLWCRPQPSNGRR